MKRETKTLIKRLFIVILAVFIAFFGVTYAWYSFTNASINVSGTTNSWCSGLDVSVTSNKNIAVSPTGTVSGYQSASYSEITITNNESMAVTVDLSLINITLDSSLISDYFAYTLTEGSTVISSGDFSDMASSSYISLTTNVSVSASGTKTYKLYLYVLDDGNCTTSQALAGTCTNGQNDMMNKSFSGVVKATVSSTWCSNYLSSAG